MAEKPVTNLIKGVGSLLDRAGAHLVKMFNYLKFCIAEDKKDIEMTITDGIQRKKYANLINFFKLFWVTLAIILFAGFFVLRMISINNRSTYKDGRKSHHGVNKFGQRY